MTEYYLTDNQALEVSIIEVLHEIESATDFYIYKKVQEKMNVSENDVYSAIENLHRKLFILSNEDITNKITTHCCCIKNFNKNQL